ncbi:MAG TPA: CHAT domain-containing protein, partial [Thermoanaerobaculia bacterium]|nr:CHAT domain-containing protein [Thermoanaerobaculia bacterium]
GDLVGQANARRGEGDALFVLGAVEPAIEAQREALTLALAMGDPLGEGNARLGLGDALFAAGDVPGALAAFELGRAAFEAAGEPVGRANALLGTGQVRAVAGQHDESLALARQARQLFEAALDQFGEGNAWHQEGEVLLRLGELEGAVAAFRRAALAAEEGGNPLGLGNAWLGQGDAQVRRADSAAALAAYGEARRIFAAIGHDLGLGSTWRGEGDALLLSGRNEEALAAYRRARDLLAAAGSWAELGNAWQGEGNLFVRLRENETALAAYRAAGRAFVIAGQPAGQSRAWRGEGTVLYQNGQHSPALAALRRARALAEEGGDRIEQGNSWWCEGLVLAATGRPSEALAAYRRARELFAAAGDGNGEGNTLLGEARALTTLGDLPGALAGAAAATALFEEHGILSASIRALLVQVRVLSRMGQFEEAAALAEEAVRRHERWRRTYVTDAQRTLEDDDEIASAYDLLVPLRARQAGREEEALGLAEEARSRTLLDALSTRRGGAPPALAGDPEVEADLARLEVIAARTADPVTRREIERRRRDLHRAQRWQEYERLVAAGNPLLVGRPLTGGEIRALAREPGGGPILLYYATASEVVAFLVPVDGGSPLVRLLHLPLDQLAERVGALRRALANPALEAQAPALARELWDLLIAPFAADLPAGAPLTVVPHGPLHRLPFETLLDPEGKPLFERWPLATAPSATVLRLLRAGRPDRVRDLFLAMAPAGGDAPRPEVGRIAALFGPAAGGGFPAAGFETYRDEAPKVRHLLIAARGTLEPGSRAETFLEIPASSDHDSQLDAAEIAGIPLAAELVTLAACDTAAAEALFSDERLDLARAFLIAGAAAVLATRWKIPDEAATYRFLEDFYRAYRRSGPDGRGQRKDAALAEARQRSRRRGDPASVWAAWVLVGEAR